MGVRFLDFHHFWWSYFINSFTLYRPLASPFFFFKFSIGFLCVQVAWEISKRALMFKAMVLKLKSVKWLYYWFVWVTWEVWTLKSMKSIHFLCWKETLKFLFLWIKFLNLYFVSNNEYRVLNLKVKSIHYSESNNY